MKTPTIIEASTAAAATPTPNSLRSRLVLRILALVTAFLGLNAALTAAPVTVPDNSFEATVFPGATNTLAAGGTESVFNSGLLTPTYYWWGSGFADVTTYPTVYVQNADTNSGLFPLTANGLLEAPADGTNYVVVGGSGDMNVWQPLGPLQSNTVYTLTVAVGIDLLNGFLPSDGSSGYGGGTGIIALVSGTQIYDIFTPGSILASLPVENTNYALGSWVDNTLTFTNGYQASGDLTVLLRGLSGFALDFDNIRLDATPVSFTAVIPTVTTDTGSNGTTVYRGTPVTLAENPAGTPPFSYVWQTDSGTSGATWTAVPSATGSSYVADTTSIVPGTPVGYRVVVTSGAGSSTSPSVTLSTIAGAPVLVRDTLPSSGSFDVVGSQVAFSAIFDGSRPITYQWLWNGTPLAGATNETLTLSLTDTNLSGNYSLLASNSLGTNGSTAQTFTVNALAPATNGIILANGLEWGSFFGSLGYNDAFTPTWTLATNSIIAGLQPSSSIGIFTDDGDGGLPVLTDGSFGQISPADNGSAAFATAGDGTTTNGIGYSITYTLPTTPSGAGWTITNITSYGGWADDGRDQQTYQVSYSTPLAPTNFSLLPWTAFFPPTPPTADDGGGVATATKMSIIPTNGVLANNVGAITINFYSLAAGQSPENGWEGYAEFQLFGAPSTTFPPAPVQGITPAFGSDVEGSSVTIQAEFTSLDPITYSWFKDGAPMQGQTNSTLILTNLAVTDTSVNPGYVLQASNALGVSVSAPCVFTVNPANGPDGAGVIIAEASQAIPGGLFTPTWTIAPGSLLAGLDPFLTAGNFQAQNSANGQPEGGPPTLTDGQYGAVGNGDTLTGASAGPSAGTALYYNLPVSSNGWNITGIATYGGWSDIGRNNQGYDVYYATTAAPDTYVLLDSLNPAYSPPITVAEPNATRVLWTPGEGVPLAQNVASIEFSFVETVFNGWEGYNELQVFGTNATVAAAAVQQAPVVGTDVAPGYGSDVVGSSVTFNATFVGADSYQWQFTPVNGTAGNLAGATNATLTLSDLNTNETGGYTLLASNTYGITPTSTAEFTVNPIPAAVGNIVQAVASQMDGNNGLGLAPSQFLPTWTIASGSLIAGQQPSTTGPGNFVEQAPGGGVPALTDGTIGELVSGGAVPNYASCGDVASGAGQYVTYTLKGSSSGYNLSSIVTYGGWPDYGRDWQYYVVMYSTVENPTSFQVLGESTNQFPEPITTAAPNTSRITWTAVGGGTLASNVAAIQFNFSPTNQENGWQGYSELQVFGTPSQGGGGVGPKGPTIGSSAISGGNLVLGGSGGTAGAGYAWLSSTNLATPLSQWVTNTTGTFDSSGNFSTSIPITHTEPGVFFVLKPL